MKTRTLISGLTVVLLPGLALAASFGDECAQSCPAQAAAPTCSATGAAPAAALAGLGYLGATHERGMIGVYLAEGDGPAVVDGLVDGGPAAQCGLQAGDQIVALDGNAMANWRQLSEAVGSRSAGETVTVTLLRDGWKKEVEITLAAAPEAPESASTEVWEAAPSTGAYSIDVTGAPGAIALAPVEGGSADGSGRPSFVITEGTGGQSGRMGAIALGVDGEVHEIDLSELGQGVHDVEVGGKKLKIHTQGLHGMHGAKAIEVEGLELDMSELHDSLSKLHDLKIDVSGVGGLSKCCENCGQTCCQATPGGSPKVFHVMGLGGVEGGVAMPRAFGVGGGAGGQGVRVFRADGHGEGTDSSGELRKRVLIERQGGGDAAAPKEMRIRRVGPSGGANSDLDALRGELEVLREELKQLRQSLRRIQAGQER